MNTFFIHMKIEVKDPIVLDVLKNLSVTNDDEVADRFLILLGIMSYIDINEVKVIQVDKEV